ncbi:MAG: methyl-accepting chemotaxis protein [Magnetococcales bacterium]|nr:methyl-accepting chemotaxis protein [Magnetococcales bacterium]
MPLNDIPIRLKLPFTIGTGLFLFAGVVLLYTLILNRTITLYEHLVTHELEIRQAAEGVVREMLQARRAEKDFLLRKNPRMPPLVERGVERAIVEARIIERLGRKHPSWGEIEPKLALVDHLDRYRQLFSGVVDLWQTRGLQPDVGEEGALRKAAHALEGILESLDDREAMIDYLHMRRMEKDYLLRQDEAFVREVERRAGNLATRLREGKWTGGDLEWAQKSLEEYRAAFARLVALDRELAGKMTLLLETVHMVEPLADEIEALARRLADEESLTTRRFAERAAWWILLGSIATILACGFLTIHMVRSLVRSIGELWRYGHDVAGGNLEAETALSSRDEIGQLAVVMREMVGRMRAIRLIADRMVMILALIGRGALPDEIQVDFHGDFRKIANALNEMIGRLKDLRLIAGRIDRISKGEIPDKLSGEFHGDFKRINDALNTIIDKLREIGGLPGVELSGG